MNPSRIPLFLKHGEASTLSASPRGIAIKRRYLLDVFDVKYSACISSIVFPRGRKKAPGRVGDDVEQCESCRVKKCL
jgi:hypothetical protein